jgi:hypothetical protein
VPLASPADLSVPRKDIMLLMTNGAKSIALLQR